MTPRNLTPDERNRIRLYFLDTRFRYGLFLLVLGLVLVELTLGKLLLLASFTWLVFVLMVVAKRPSEDELDRLVSRDLDSLIDTSIRALDRSEDEIQVPPLALQSPLPRAAGPGGLASTRPRIGRDNRLRSPVNRAVVLLPMENRLGVYSCDQDAITGQAAKISVEEHQYREIVSLQIEEDVARTPDPKNSGSNETQKQRRSVQRLSLEFTNGRRVEVPVATAWQRDGEGTELRQTELERALAALRVFLRG